jgi:SHS2 domain-containing protein
MRAEVDEELARLSERLASGARQGHRSVPHTADLRVEAWAPTREKCLAEAARGLVDSFAVVEAARPRRTAERRFIASSDQDLLVAVIDEVIYRLDADGEISVTLDVQPVPDGGVVLSMQLADVGEAEITGTAPMAATLHDLRCAPGPAGRWSCGITIDV